MRSNVFDLALKKCSMMVIFGIVGGVGGVVIAGIVAFIVLRQRRKRPRAVQGYGYVT